jgi:alanyl-tRNA synthetase
MPWPTARLRSRSSSGIGTSVGQGKQARHWPQRSLPSRSAPAAAKRSTAAATVSAALFLALFLALFAAVMALVLVWMDWLSALVGGASRLAQVKSSGMLFGEKYGDKVRVVMIDPAYSIELCGGTHVGSTGELGIFKLVAEAAVAAGVRSVEAVCGEAAEHYINHQLQQLDAVKELIKNTKDPLQAIQNLQEELSQWKKKAEQMENRILIALRNELISKAKSINGVAFAGEMVELSSADALKKLANDLNHQLENSLVVLCANISGKAAVTIAISEALVKEKNLDAGKLIKEVVAPLIKGGGGGQKTLATAGGQDAGGFEKIIQEIREKVSV